MTRTAWAKSNANRDMQDAEAAHFCLAFDEVALQALEDVMTPLQDVSLLGAGLTSAHLALPAAIRAHLHEGYVPEDEEADDWVSTTPQHDLEHHVGAQRPGFDEEATVTLQVFPSDGTCYLQAQLHLDGEGWDTLGSPRFTVASLREMMR
jgi:hypothetical protein